jgi:hypothetical protein
MEVGMKIVMTAAEVEESRALVTQLAKDYGTPESAAALSAGARAHGAQLYRAAFECSVSIIALLLGY